MPRKPTPTAATTASSTSASPYKLSLILLMISLSLLLQYCYYYLVVINIALPLCSFFFLLALFLHLRVAVRRGAQAHHGHDHPIPQSHLGSSNGTLERWCSRIVLSRIMVCRNMRASIMRAYSLLRVLLCFLSTESGEPGTSDADAAAKATASQRLMLKQPPRRASRTPWLWTDGVNTHGAAA